MATKNISITLEAYKILASLKEEKESFSDVILKSFGEEKGFDGLSQYVGIISPEGGDALKKGIKEARARHRKRHKIRIRDMN